MFWIMRYKSIAALPGALRLSIHGSSYSTCAFNFQRIFESENVERCKKQLYHGSDFKSMPWMKDPEQIRKSAVLVPLCIIDGEPSLLYTVRSMHLNSHRGEVSFPGGMHEVSDPHLLNTALREAEEEIGLKEDQVDVWGQLMTVPGKNFEIAVTPVLANCGELDIHSLQLNPDEVESIFAISICKLCDPELNGYTYFKKGDFHLPVYTGGKQRVWGLTAIITHLCLRLIIPDKSVYTLHIPISRRISR